MEWGLFVEELLEPELVSVFPEGLELLECLVALLEFAQEFEKAHKDYPLPKHKY